MKIKKLVMRGGLIVVVIVMFFIVINSIENIKNKKPVNIVYVSKSVDEKNEFWMALILGAKVAAKEYNVNLTTVAPKDEADYEEQNRLIERAIEQKPDAILLSPSSYTKTTHMAEKIKENKIKLILVDSTIDSKVSDSIVSTENIVAGQKLGDYIKDITTEDTKIAVVSHVEKSSTAIEREEGLRKGLGKDEDKIEEVVFCESRYDIAYNLTKNLIYKNPKINVIVALNEYSSVGSAKAIKELGLENEILIMGFDNSIEEVKLLEEGVIKGIVIQKPFNMGYFGVEQAVKIAKGENYIEYLDCGSELITKEVMYTDENQKMLFPFVGRQFREIND